MYEVVVENDRHSDGINVGVRVESTHQTLLLPALDIDTLTELGTAIQDFVEGYYAGLDANSRI